MRLQMVGVVGATLIICHWKAESEYRTAQARGRKMPTHHLTLDSDNLVTGERVEAPLYYWHFIQIHRSLTAAIKPIDRSGRCKRHFTFLVRVFVVHRRSCTCMTMSLFCLYSYSYYYYYFISCLYS